MLIRPSHTVTYDVKVDAALRAVQIGGTLAFARDRDTLLNVGLLRLQPGEQFSEEGFDCDLHQAERDAKLPQPVLEIGTAEQPIPAKYSAVIRLTLCEGQDKNSFPAVVNCQGRMDLHGAPLAHTWTKLGQPAKSGDTTISTLESVADWKPGDRIIVTATTRQNKIKKTFKSTLRDGGQTEVRLITAIDKDQLTLDKPLEFDHIADGDYRADVANLNRNVVIESADPAVARGHTMYHRGSAGSISYAEFRHLGKEGVLGRYSLHFHLCGDTMRGSSVVGASIWDSGNRWITIHGTNYLVVRDCVGYQSVGHGFFLEDGTEESQRPRPQPRRAGLHRQAAAEAGAAVRQERRLRLLVGQLPQHVHAQHGGRVRRVRLFLPGPENGRFRSGSRPAASRRHRQKVDIRTLPFVRFEDNEAHCQRRHSLNVGGGAPFGPPNVAGIGPDKLHPFLVRNTKLWNVHWGIHPVSPSLRIDTMTIHNAEYGVWRPEYKDHYYRAITFTDVPERTIYAFTSGKPNEDAEYPDPASLQDDFAPISVITFVGSEVDGKRLVRGTTSDNSEVAAVTVNGQPAKGTRGNFAEWEIELPASTVGKSLTAAATDAAGNQEARPHVVQLP